MKKTFHGASALFVGVLLGSSLAILTGSPSPEGESASIDVSGDFGSPVTLVVNGEPDTLVTQTKEVTQAGQGRTIVNGGQILFRATSFDYVTGAWTEVPNSGRVMGTSATEMTLGVLYEALLHEREGSRVLLTQPDDTTDNAEIVVIDILPTTSVGDPSENALPDGWLSLSNDVDGRPIATGESSNKQVAQTKVLLTGAGPQVEASDVILANYRIFSRTGEVVEDTWAAATVPTIALTDVYDGLRDGLTDQRVGSRVAIFVPAANAQGNESVRIVVDILAIIDRPAD